MSSTSRLLLALTVVLACGACASNSQVGVAAAADDADAGTLTLPNGRQVRITPDAMTYSGEGSYAFADGETYTGTFVDGRASGDGRSVSPEGVVYEGQWANGVEHGQGRLTLPDGGVYEGDFLDGNQTGQGVFSSPAGRYNGLWRNGVPEGHGTFKYADSSVYVGQWFGGQRHGNGRWQAADGAIYDGNWAGNRPHGIGELVEASGGRYRGEWLAGQRTGYGIWEGLAGDRFEGMWRANRRQGYGWQRSLEQHEYTGNWQADRRQGNGELMIPDVSTHRGSFVAGVPEGSGERSWAGAFAGTQCDSAPSRDEHTAARQDQPDGGCPMAGVSGSGRWQGDLLLDGTLVTPSGHTFSGTMIELAADGPRAAPAFRRWLGARADGDPDAGWLHGIALLEWSRPTDPERAERSWQGAADAGHIPASARLGRLLIGRDVQAGLRWLEVAADAGNPLANLRLAQLYQHGRQVPRDDSRAMYYYDRITTRSLTARNNLAWLLATSDNPSLHQGQRAMELARPLVAARPDHAGFLDTLAAACARAGQHREALRLQRRAVARLAAGGVTDELAELELRLALYARGQAFTNRSSDAPSVPGQTNPTATGATP